jgi:hypothetical protein
LFFFFCFPVGGAESSAIGRSLNTQHASLFCHNRSAFADNLVAKKSRQPWKRWPLEAKEKKKLKEKPLFSEELVLPTGLHNMACAARPRMSFLV